MHAACRNVLTSAQPARPIRWLHGLFGLGPMILIAAAGPGLPGCAQPAATPRTGLGSDRPPQEQAQPGPNQTQPAETAPAAEGPRRGEEPSRPFPPAPEQPEPALPPWLTITARASGEAPPQVQARWKGGNVIAVETRRVRGLAIDLRRVPVDPDRPVIVRLDGQPVVFPAERGPIVEFERTPAGIWQIRPRRD